MSETMVLIAAIFILCVFFFVVFSVWYWEQRKEEDELMKDLPVEEQLKIRELRRIGDAISR